MDHWRYNVGIYDWDPEDIAEDINLPSLHSAIAVPSLFTHSFESVLQQHFMYINGVDRMGMTPLHWAAWTRHHIGVELLLHWKANVNARDSDGMTPLHHACLSGDVKTVELLLDHGAHVNAEDDTGSTPLFYVSDSSVDFVPLLVQRGANVKHQTHDGANVLHLVAFLDKVSLINEFIKHGVDVNGVDQKLWTPLHGAVASNQANAVSALINACKVHEVCHPNAIFLVTSS